MRLLERIATCYCACYRVDVVHDRSNACSDHIAYPERSKAEACYCKDKADNSETFVPRSISKLEMVLVGASAIKYLTYYTKDVDCGDNNRAARCDGEHTVESISILE